MKIYLDTSALNRIFDDQSQPRIYLEATSMFVIFMLIESQGIELGSSDVLLFENDQNPHDERRVFVSLILQKANGFYPIDDKILRRAQEIEKFNIKGLDALHLACAEELKVDCFITCDEKITKRYRGSMRVKNPVNFVADVLSKEENDDN